MTDLEIEWRSFQPHYSSRELLEIFPEAESYLRDRLMRYNRYLKSVARIVKKQLKHIARYKGFQKYFWEEIIRMEDGDLLNLCQKEIERIQNFFRKEIPGQITDADIQRAREYPLKQLLGTTKDKVLCPHHKEKNPSCFLKNNFGYCFSCGYTFDSIKYLQDRENIGFVEAVKRLM